MSIADGAVKVFSVLKEGALLPEYQTPGSAGADLYAYLAEPITLNPMERKLIPTGLFVELPVGYELQVRPRSGLALKYGITVLNTPGTVDSDYRGELCVLLVNFGSEPFTVQNGDRIAQAVVAQAVQVSFVQTDALSKTGRGTGGYGSTGIA
ncbi:MULTISPECIES: dUTP diphosphatase [unclassified Treponema]|uniref:dUTP diphosphatase n=1 Tax=unclassified Treponema TaxID=2638727 RepID=UPI0005300DAC|nr:MULTISPECIES: dUTP diphosphatase [unclassified Treponema]AIW89920.1 deoxyuridine 5'-triphosphate nucleotidohydrolase [Treponema sp. OMZ 838]UTC43308.1 dUTP diphosphatase [Treponema sp. OMZ 857]UTC50097.1 dUTP diphosphatase [Treponema sp. OMZ 855]